MLHVTTLGGLVVERLAPPGTPANLHTTVRPAAERVLGAAAQPRRLALIAMIARAGHRGISRDRLLATLWPDADDESARHALKQSLYALRRDAGVGELFLGTRDLSLNTDVARCDVIDFEECARSGQLERAAACYTGSFLDGFRLAAVPEFECWMEEERRTLEALLSSVLDRLVAQARSHNDAHALVTWLKRRAALDPLSARLTVDLMQALLAVGERAAALQQARVYDALVAQSLDIPPDNTVQHLAAAIRDGHTPATPITAPNAQATSPLSPLPPAPSAPPAIQTTNAPPARQTTSTRTTPLPATPNIFVSPFTPITQTTDARLLADSLHEELLLALGRRRELQVFGRSGDDLTPATAAAQTGHAPPSAMLEGSIRVLGDSARITARLTRPAGGPLAWTDRFDLPMPHAITALDACAATIADYTARELRGAAGLPTGPTAREQADALYAAGLRAWTPQGAGLGQGLEEFREAVALDPSHARAHAALAEAYTQLAFYGFLPARRAASLVQAAAREAMRLAPQLAESHLALGTSLLWVDRDFEEGTRELERALELDPSLAMARARLAFVRLCHEGPREWERSDALRAATTVGAPGLSRIMYGQQLLAAERFDEAIEALLQSIDIEAPSFLAYHWLSAAYVARGMGAEAVAAAVAEASLSDRHPWSMASLIVACVTAGQRRRAETLHDTLKRRAASGYVQASVLGIAHAALGDLDAGMRALEQAVEEHDPSMMMLRNFPTFATFRQHPRFRPLLRQAGWRDWDTAEFRIPER